jgi:putative transposase
MEDEVLKIELLRQLRLLKVLVNQAFRYELKPNNEQIGLLNKSCGVARFAWNWALGRRIEQYQNNTDKERFTDAIKQHKELNALKKSEFPWMYDVSKCAPQEALRNLDAAFKNMYRRIKNHDKRKGFPKFKKKGQHDSFSLNGSVKVVGEYIQLPRIGYVRTKEPLYKFKGRILGVTVSKEADRWYCSLSVEVDRIISKSTSDEIIGIDLGLKDFAVITNGEGFDYKQAPKPHKKRLEKNKLLHRQLDKKQKGSNNRKKAQLRLSRNYRNIRNERKDSLNKLTTELAKTKSVIVIEDLNVKGMMGNHKLARSISDVSWGDFHRQLEYKTVWYGSKLIKIDRFFPSSKMCSKCGEINKDLDLSQRTWICPHCGAILNRDENAATNIRNEGIRILNTESNSGIYACGESVRPPFKEGSSQGSRN